MSNEFLLQESKHDAFGSVGHCHSMSRMPLLVALIALCVGCGARSQLVQPDPPAADVALPTLDATPAIDVAPRDVTGVPIDTAPPRRLAWTRLAAASTTRPPARMSHFMLYDARDDSVLVIGGYDPYELRGQDGARLDVWRLALGTEQWNRVATLDRPLVSLLGGAAMFDASSTHVVMIAAADLMAASQLLSLDVRTGHVTRLGGEPWPSGWSVMAAGPLADRDWLVATGAVFVDTVRTTWAYDVALGRWTTLATMGPVPRSHAMLADGGDRLYLYAGYYGDPYRDLWQLDPATAGWTERRFASPLPPRLDHRVLVDRARNRLVAFGGYAAATIVHENLLLVDLATGVALAPTLDPAPAGRRDHGFVLDPWRRAILFGGAIDSDHCLDDTWMLTLD